MASVSMYSSASPRATTRRRRSWGALFAAPFSRTNAARIKALAAVLSVLLALEGLIRLAEYTAGATLSDRQSVAACKLPAGALWRGRHINSSGYWNREFDGAAPPSGVQRIALLGDSALLAGDAETNVAARLEHLLPHVEVDHFALPTAGPREFAAQFAGDVVRRRPQTVIVCLPMAARAEPTPHDTRLADWHTLHFFQSLLGPSPAHADFTNLSPQLSETLDYDAYVRRRAASIATCRLSSMPGEESQRREAQDAVARLAENCRRQDIKLLLVLVPGEYQLSPQLTAAFCRRQELDPTALDLELPQRRWRAYAEHLGLATIDLLPAFRDAKEVLYRTNSPEWNDRGLAVAAATIACGL